MKRNRKLVSIWRGLSRLWKTLRLRWRVWRFQAVLIRPYAPGTLLLKRGDIRLEEWNTALTGIPRWSPLEHTDEIEEAHSPYVAEERTYSYLMLLYRVSYYREEEFDPSFRRAIYLPCEDEAIH